MIIKKIILWPLILLIIWISFIASSIWRFGNQDFAQAADCIIVLGAAVRGDKPSPVFEERIRHGVNLYNKGLAKKIIFTGGFGEGKRYSESGVGFSVAINKGVPSSDILIEERSRTTQRNLYEAKQLMQENKLTSAVIVSDPLHMKRALLMAKDLNIEALSSPTPSSRYRGVKSRMEFLAREVYFYHHYLIRAN